jgi:hypothetical protein
MGNFDIRLPFCKNSMTENELKLRPGKFAVAVLNFSDQPPNRKSANIIGNQLGR